MSSNDQKSLIYVPGYQTETQCSTVHGSMDNEYFSVHELKLKVVNSPKILIELDAVIPLFDVQNEKKRTFQKSNY